MSFEDKIQILLVEIVYRPEHSFLPSSFQVSPSFDFEHVPKMFGFETSVQVLSPSHCTEYAHSI